MTSLLRLLGSFARFAGGIAAIPSSLLLGFLIKTEGPLAVYFSIMTLPAAIAFLSAIFLEKVLTYPFGAGAVQSSVGCSAQFVIGIPIALIAYAVFAAITNHEKFPWIARDLFRVVLAFITIAFPMLIFAAFMTVGLSGAHIPEKLSLYSLGFVSGALGLLLGFPFMHRSLLAVFIAAAANMAVIASFIDAWRRYYRTNSGWGTLDLAADKSPKEKRSMAVMAIAGTVGMMIGIYLIYEPHRPRYFDADAAVAEASTWYSNMSRKYRYSVTYTFIVAHTGKKIEHRAFDCSSNFYAFARTNSTFPVRYADDGNEYRIDYARHYGVSRSWDGNGGVGLGILSAGIGFIIIGIAYFADLIRRRRRSKAGGIP